jgi:UDP-3-O-[3-hydroxymyristoyl] glucosamine N-acyltransferase
MVDSRFFETRAALTLNELIQVCGADGLSAEHAAQMISGVSSLTSALPGEICFFSDARYAADLANTQASACFVRAADAALLPAHVVPVIVRHPQAAWAKVANLLYTEVTFSAADPALHPLAHIAPDAVIAPGAVVGAGVAIGARTQIGPNAVIGAGVVIGADGRIGAGASVRHAVIGDRVKILANAVIGEAGFGATASAEGVIDIPQLGRVVIGDDVTIGACTTVDRGALGDTVLGDQVKIDNLVQIGHNCQIGRGTAMAAHTGISGSVIIGQYVQLAGRAGVADHVTIGDQARIGAASGVMESVPAGETWAGYPAKPIRQWLRETVTLSKLAKPGQKG